MVFGKAVPKESPVIGRHTATATSGAHLPSLVKRRGGGRRRYQSHGPFQSQHSSRRPSASAALPVALAGRRGTANGFWESGPEGEPGHRQAHSHGHQRGSSPLLGEAEGGGGPVNRCL